ncbi:dual specificity protein phosphatase 18-like [Oryzias latipes]
MRPSVPTSELESFQHFFVLIFLMNRSNPAGLSGLCRVTDQLYLSSRKSANDSSQLKVNKITCIINVSEARSSCPPGVDEYVHIPVSDSPLSNLRDHFDWVADKVRVTAENGGRTLVHCNAGVSRSAALCMAFLMRHRGATLLDAHAWLKSCRPIIRPNHGFWRQLIVYETELRGCSSVRMVPSPIGEIPDIYEEEVRNITPLL